MAVSATAVGEPPRLPVQWALAGVGAAALAAGALFLGADGWRRGVLLLVGGMLGVSLYHAAFGFTAAYRNAIVRREISGVTAQLIMLAAAMLLFAPVLAQGEIFGQRVVGAVAPVGVQVAVGSFLFALGMQLGGGCGSGTLYTVGGGSTRMLMTLAAFCAGGFWASLDMPFWRQAPGWGSISLARELGWGVALPLQLGVLAAIWFGLRRWAGGTDQRPLWGDGFTWRRLLRGPWPLLLSAGLLAGLNWVTLVVAGHPWTITWGFTLWGAKAAAAVGWDPSTSPFWTGGFTQRALDRGVLEDITSVMNIGIILGALTAAGLAGKFAPVLRLPPRSLLAAAIGGLLMGYGARIAFGCNIGAFFSGVASTSLHGWLWIVCAIAGSWIGVRLRPWFGLTN
ncbi:MAG: YeeE/YedE family protein [Proteobacteria bacterium]|nr:YeeE/YedE family protein [Pseudomonadota bacterium]